MVWDQLSINKPHLVYIILGGFTSLFMLCSSVIKERLYIGEATVATAVGIIFGPHAASLIDPDSWGNTDQITEEFSRIVLVVQCFAVGVELPKAYMEKHWRSVTALLVPIMTFGWLITSLFIWGLFTPHLNWLDSLTIAACVTATDPVLASSVVGKGKFAKRVPKHLRDILSAESGCNDGMAFPFIYLALYIIRYRHHPGEVAFHWICYTILYECIWGAVYGVLVGYIARRLIRYAHEHQLIDRESFLVFYFVLALFCAGSGSILGMDDLLIGFACGVGFSNDGWFMSETEESHVSNVIDLLLNLTFFVYFGTIIPWDQFNSGYMGLDVWKLVVLAILVLLFRRIPAMLAFKPFIPDIKTWREALFAGHFGPIGVGALFVAILARAELETGETTPLKELPPATAPNDNIIVLVWPIVTFLVLTSIIVHGSSIAVFTLGKHINTLTLTMSYTTANEPSWMERLPRIQSRSRTSMSMARSESSLDEKTGFSPGVLPIGAPGTFLRRQKEEENPSRSGSRAPSRHRAKRSKNWESEFRPGGPVSQSAIKPAPRQESPDMPMSPTDSETLAMKSDPPSDEKTPSPQNEGASDEAVSPGEIYEEGDQTVYEDEEGNVLAVERDEGDEDQNERERDEEREGRRLMKREHADENAGVAPTKDDPDTDPGHEALEEVKSVEDKVKAAAERPARNWREGWNKMGSMAGFKRKDEHEAPKPKAEKPKETRGPARAYQYGNTIILEDEDGEVIKKLDIPGPGQGNNLIPQEKSKQRIGQMGRLLGLGPKESKAVAEAPASEAPASDAGPSENQPKPEKVDEPPQQEDAGGDKNDDDDDRLRFTISSGGRRLSTAEFIDEIRLMDPNRRAMAVEDSNVPESVKQEARKDARERRGSLMRGISWKKHPLVPEPPVITEQPLIETEEENQAALKPSGRRDSNEGDPNNQNIPFHDVSAELRRFQMRGGRGGEGGETAAERRRRTAAQRPRTDDDSDDDGTERVPPGRGRAGPSDPKFQRSADEAGETAAERRRREGALGIRKEADSDSEEDDQPREVPARQGIRFAEPQPAQRAPPKQSALRWGKNVGR